MRHDRLAVMAAMLGMALHAGAAIAQQAPNQPPSGEAQEKPASVKPAPVQGRIEGAGAAPQSSAAGTGATPASSTGPILFNPPKK